MKLLVLTENTGGGHNSCAASIKAEFLSRDSSNVCDIASYLNMISPELNKMTCNFQIWSYRHVPELMKVAFSLYDMRSGNILQQDVLYNVIASGYKKLYKFILENNYDFVVSVHPFSAAALSKIKKKNPEISIPFAFIATDCHNDLTGDENNLDFYFVPNNNVVPKFTSTGISPDRIIASGIPVRQMFFVKRDKEKAKEALGINPSCLHLLIMSGSMGAGAIKDVVIKLTSADIPPDCVITVICGSNKSMKKELDLACDELDNFKILGFVDDIGLYMDSADLYITKPGGISTMEADVKHLPMILVNTVGGCETSNLEYYKSIGLAKTAKNVNSIVELCCKLLNSPDVLSEMSSCEKKSMEELNGARIITNTITKYNLL